MTETELSTVVSEALKHTALSIQQSLDRSRFQLDLSPEPIISNRLTADEAALLIGVKKETLTQWRHNKRYRLAYTKIGRRIFYDFQDVLRFLEDRKVS